MLPLDQPHLPGVARASRPCEQVRLRADRNLGDPAVPAPGDSGIRRRTAVLPSLMTPVTGLDLPDPEPDAFRKFRRVPSKAASERRQEVAHGVSRGAASVATSPGGAKANPTRWGHHVFRPSGANPAASSSRPLFWGSQIEFSK